MTQKGRVGGVLFVVMIGCAAAAATLGARAGRQAQVANAARGRVVTAATAFLATLDAGQRAKANIDLNGQTRTIWSNLPTGIKMQVGATTRNGLKLGDMTPAQEKAAMALVAAALSREGYDKVTAIVDADELLEQRAAPTRPATQAIRFGRKEYFVAVLGKPAAGAT